MCARATGQSKKIQKIKKRSLVFRSRHFNKFLVGEKDLKATVVRTWLPLFRHSPYPPPTSNKLARHLCCRPLYHTHTPLCKDPSSCLLACLIACLRPTCLFVCLLACFEHKAPTAPNNHRLLRTLKHQLPQFQEPWLADLTTQRACRSLLRPSPRRNEHPHPLMPEHPSASAPGRYGAPFSGTLVQDILANVRMTLQSLLLNMEDTSSLQAIAFSALPRSSTFRAVSLLSPSSGVHLELGCFLLFHGWGGKVEKRI